MRYRDTVTRLRAPDTVGPDGATIPGDWATVTEPELDKADYQGEFQPVSTTEDIVSQQRSESTHKAFLPSEADILVTDRLRFLGIDYTIDGEPEHHRQRGRPHHIEVFCFRVVGG